MSCCCGRKNECSSVTEVVCVNAEGGEPEVKVHEHNKRESIDVVSWSCSELLMKIHKAPARNLTLLSTCCWIQCDLKEQFTALLHPLLPPG